MDAAAIINFAQARHPPYRCDGRLELLHWRPDGTARTANPNGKHIDRERNTRAGLRTPAWQNATLKTMTSRLNRKAKGLQQ